MEKKYKILGEFWDSVKGGAQTSYDFYNYGPKGPPKDNRKKRRYIREVKTWGVNEAKWKAATAYCKDRNWKFQILTEDNLTKY